jgi:HSP20 family molecular chaperone IbpA
MSEQSEIVVTEREEALEGQGPEALVQGPTFKPRIDLYETAHQITLVADIPGARSEDVELDVKDHVLTLVARVRPVESRWRPVHQEWRQGHFMRQLKLGHQIDQAKISASLKDGVLTVELPKVEQAQPRRIAIT